jgi:hypothetical protein
MITMTVWSFQQCKQKGGYLSAGRQNASVGAIEPGSDGWPNLFVSNDELASAGRELPSKAC